MLTLTWGIDIIWKDNTTNRELNFKNTLYILRLRGRGFHAKPVSFFKCFYSWLVVWCLEYKALLDLPNYGSDSWRRHTLKGVCWCVQGEVGSSFGLVCKWMAWQRELPEGTEEGRRLCAMYGALSYLWDLEERRGGHFYREELTPLDTTLLNFDKK